MLRTIVVTVAGLILSMVLAAVATSFMLSHTEFGRLMTGDSSGMADRWRNLGTDGTFSDILRRWHGWPVS